MVVERSGYSWVPVAKSPKEENEAPASAKAKRASDFSRVRGAPVWKPIHSATADLARPGVNQTGVSWSSSVSAIAPAATPNGFGGSTSGRMD
ncbi:hypothetical protein D3C72_2326800 [compost metagenome]